MTAGRVTARFLFGSLSVVLFHLCYRERAIDICFKLDATLNNHICLYKTTVINAT